MAKHTRDAETQAFLVAFGARVRELRRARALSQERLAGLAGIDRQTVNRLENASHALSTAHLGALAKALDVSPRELMPDP